MHRIYKGRYEVKLSNGMTLEVEKDIVDGMWTAYLGYDLEPFTWIGKEHNTKDSCVFEARLYLLRNFNISF